MARAKKTNGRKKIFQGIAFIFIFGLILPESPQLPLQSSSAPTRLVGDALFEAPIGSSIHATTNGLVVYQDYDLATGFSLGILGARWRVHQYKNLNERFVSIGDWVKAGDKIGTLGYDRRTFARPRLEYHILSLIPYLWRIEPESWHKAFFLDPYEELAKVSSGKPQKELSASLK